MDRICVYCYAPFDDESNNPEACKFHPKFYFPFDRDKDGFYQKGWQCCGSEDRMAAGCTFSHHRDDIIKKYRPNSIIYDYVPLDTHSAEKCSDGSK